MKTSDFDFALPSELIALHPAARREDARLLVLDRATGRRSHARFSDIGTLLPPRALLVLNETRVFPARLRARRSTGGQVEILLVRPAPVPNFAAAGERWECMTRNAGNLAPGARLQLESAAAGAFACTVTYLGKVANAGSRATQGAGGDSDAPSKAEPSGLVYLNFAFEGEGTVLALAEACGEIPLPPYIEQGRRDLDPTAQAPATDDRIRYQTVYARAPGAVAAPTAGLHFTAALLDELVAAGHQVARLCLHVGPGTFRPVKTEDPAAHVMDEETYEISQETAEVVTRAKREGRPVIAVGTTSVRALESAARAAAVAPTARGDVIAAGPGVTRLFLVPGRPLHVVDGLITNFHLPRSTLLMLVAALAGREAILAAYAEAVASGYRFYSYGDAMLIRP